MCELITTYHHQLSHLFRNLDLLEINWGQHNKLRAQLKPVHRYMVTGKIDLENKFPFTPEITGIVLSPDPVEAMADFLIDVNGCDNIQRHTVVTGSYADAVRSCTTDLEAVTADYQAIIAGVSEHEKHQSDHTKKLWDRIHAIVDVLLVNNPHVWSTGLVYDKDLMRIRMKLSEGTHLNSLLSKDRELILNLACSADPVLETSLPGLTGHIIVELRERLETTKTTPVCISTLRRLGLYSKYLDGQLF